MDPSYNDFLKIVLPESICDYFELTGYKKDTERERIDLYLQEISTVPAEYATARLTSKGFFDQVTIQDFPIRGHNVFMHIKRRRWLNGGS